MFILKVSFDENCDDLRIEKGCLDPKPFLNPHDHHEFAFEVLLPNQPLLPVTLHCPKDIFLFGHVILSSTLVISQFLDHVGSNPNPIAVTSHFMDLVESYLPNHAFSTSQLVDPIGSNPNPTTMTSHSMELVESYLPTPAPMTIVVGSNPNLAMDFSESSLSKPTLVTFPPMNDIESSYHPDPTPTTSQPMNHIESNMILSILTSLHGVFHEQNPTMSQVVPFEVQPSVFY